MIHSLLIGLVGGMRSMTPLAAVALTARNGTLPRDNGAPHLLADPLVVAGLVALAAGELGADKWRKAPDRIIAPGIAARVVTGAVAGAALAPKDQRATAAALGAIGAVASAFVTFNLRIRSMEEHSQLATGLVEDALVLGATAAIIQSASARQEDRHDLDWQR